MRAPHLVVALLLSAAACGGDPLGPNALVVTEVDVVPAGPVSDSVVVSVVVQNRSRTPIRVPACFGMDLEARNAAGELIWQRIPGYILGICAPELDEIMRGEQRAWSASWPLVDEDGRRVPPGTYRLTAVLRSLAGPGGAEVRAGPVSVVVL